MTQKVGLVAFNGELMCFAHVLLNALDMEKKGYDVKIIMEGAATKLIKTLSDDKEPFANLYAEVREKGLIDCVCMACAAKMGSLESAKEQGLPVCDEVMGHPSLESYIKQGYSLITF